jgi:hypothetical protein
MKKIKEWLWRYIPAEFFATVGAIGSAVLLYIITDNRLIAAYAGTIGENIGYYGFISISDLKNNKEKYHKLGKKFGIIGYIKTVRDLVLEFGFSEALDSLLVRPFCMYWFPIWMPTYDIGIFTGKFIADVIFYIPTITAYELKKKYVKD